MDEPAYEDALTSNPNTTIIRLGTSGSRLFNWKYKTGLIKGVQIVIDALKGLPPQPEIYLCYLPKVCLIDDGINNDIISREIIPMIRKLVEENDLFVIDLHTTMDEMPGLFPDHIHPNEKGAQAMAEAAYQSISTLR